MKSSRAIAAGMVAFAICVCFSWTALSCEPRIKLYALEYGTSLFPSSEVFAKAALSGRTDLPAIPEVIQFAWLFYLVQTPEATVLIDTGFRDKDLAARFGVTSADPVVILREAGFAPEDITDIIITHAHFDHIGCIDAFPGARIHIQADAYAYFMKNPSISGLSDFLKGNKNLRLYTGQYTLGKYIRVLLVSGHSAGSCAVSVELPSGRVLLTGDEAYVDENVKYSIPVGSAVDQTANLAFLQDIRKSGVRFFTFHSPAVVGPGRAWKLIE